MNLHRYPHLSREGPADPLDLLRSLPPGDAREAERMLQREHAHDATFLAVQVVESALPSGGFDRLQAQAVATGGGRRRPTHTPAE